MAPQDMFQPDIRQAFKDGSAVNWDKQDVIHDYLYDWQAYAAGGQVQLAFFNEAINSGTSLFDATQKKTYEDTNMEQSGIMPRGEAFLVKHICLRFVSGVSAINSVISANVLATLPAAPAFAGNDEESFWNNGYGEFRVVNKIQARSSMANFTPPNNRVLTGVSAAGLTNAVQAVIVDAAGMSISIAGTHVANNGPLFSLASPGVLLEHNMRFTFNLNWTSAVAMPSGVSGKIEAMLHGVRMRVSQ